VGAGVPASRLLPRADGCRAFATFFEDWAIETAERFGCWPAWGGHPRPPVRQPRPGRGLFARRSGQRWRLFQKSGEAELARRPRCRPLLTMWPSAPILSYMVK